MEAPYSSSLSVMRAPSSSFSLCSSPVSRGFLCFEPFALQTGFSSRPWFLIKPLSLSLDGVSPFSAFPQFHEAYMVLCTSERKVREKWDELEEGKSGKGREARA